MKGFNYNYDVIIQKSKVQIVYTNLYIVPFGMHFV